MRTKFIVVSGIALVGLILTGLWARDGIPQWLKQEKVKREIVRYLVIEEGEKNAIVQSLYGNLASQKDILCEFHTWVQTRHYPEETKGAITVQGYTARKIAKVMMGIWEPDQVYNYLVSLRKAPRRTLKALDEKFGILPVVSNAKSSQIEPVSDAERQKLKQTLINYLVCERNMKTETAEDYYKSFARHEDILKEFCTWIGTKRYIGPKQGAVVVNGYSKEQQKYTKDFQLLALFMT